MAFVTSTQSKIVYFKVSTQSHQVITFEICLIHINVKHKLYQYPTLNTVTSHTCNSVNKIYSWDI